MIRNSIGIAAFLMLTLYTPYVGGMDRELLAKVANVPGAFFWTDSFADLLKQFATNGEAKSALYELKLVDATSSEEAEWHREVDGLFESIERHPFGGDAVVVLGVRELGPPAFSIVVRFDCEESEIRSFLQDIEDVLSTATGIQIDGVQDKGDCFLGFEYEIGEGLLAISSDLANSPLRVEALSTGNVNVESVTDSRTFKVCSSTLHTVPGTSAVRFFLSHESILPILKGSWQRLNMYRVPESAWGASGLETLNALAGSINFSGDVLDEIESVIVIDSFLLVTEPRRAAFSILNTQEEIDFNVPLPNHDLAWWFQASIDAGQGFDEIKRVYEELNGEGSFNDAMDDLFLGAGFDFDIRDDLVGRALKVMRYSNFVDQPKRRYHPEAFATSPSLPVLAFQFDEQRTVSDRLGQFLEFAYSVDYRWKIEESRPNGHYRWRPRESDVSAYLDSLREYGTTYDGESYHTRRSSMLIGNWFYYRTHDDDAEQLFSRNDHAPHPQLKSIENSVSTAVEALGINGQVCGLFAYWPRHLEFRLANQSEQLSSSQQSVDPRHQLVQATVTSTGPCFAFLTDVEHGFGITLIVSRPTDVSDEFGRIRD